MAECSIPGCPTQRLARGWCPKHYRRWRLLGDPGEAENRPNHVPGPEEDRFIPKVDFSTPEGCWRWMGSHNPKGYGQFTVQRPMRKLIQAHRWAWERYVGPIPDGLEIDHLCRTRDCVNPDHMEPVSHKVNIQRRWIGVT